MEESEFWVELLETTVAGETIQELLKGCSGLGIQFRCFIRLLNMVALPDGNKWMPPLLRSFTVIFE